MLYFIIAVSIIFILFMAVFITSFFIARFIARPPLFSREEEKEYYKSKEMLQGTEVLKREETTFTMDDGYVIHGDISLNTDQKKFMVLVHGHQVTRESEMKFSALFYNLGFSIVLIDIRGHGDNEKCGNTMSYKEGKDLAQVVTQIKERYGKDCEIGLHGTSLGASACLSCLQYHPDVKFVIEDCGFAEIKIVMTTLLKKYHLIPFIFLPFINMCFKMFYGFSFEKAAPVKSLKGNKVPLLVIHGTVDTLVTFDNAELIYNASEGYKKMAAFDIAGHCGCIRTDKEKYIREVTEFINNI